MKQLSILILIAVTMGLVAVACGSPQPTATPAPTATPVAATTPSPGATAQPVTPTPSRDLAQYFGGKTVTVIVPYNPGGGFDISARLLAPYFSKYLPGNPRTIVQNVVGGGGLQGVERAMRAPQDGLTIVNMHPIWVIQQLAGVELPTFDYREVRYVGSSEAGASGGIMCSQPQVATSWEGVVALGRRITVGDIEPGQGPTIASHFMDLVGAPVRMVFGYGGGAEILAAYDRREIDATNRCTESGVTILYPEWVTQQRLAPLVWWSQPPDQDWLQRLGHETSIPNVLDVVDATPDQAAAFNTARELVSYSKLFTLQPGVPDDVYEAWKVAMQQAMVDPEFRQRADASGRGAEIGYGSPEEFLGLFQAIDSLTPEGRALFRTLIGGDAY